MPKKHKIQNRETFFGLRSSTAEEHFVVVGIPWDATTSYEYGAAAGASAIRSASRLHNRFTEEGVDLATSWRVCDHGNIKLRNDLSRISELEEAVRSRVNLHNHRDPAVLFLGGDHFVTYPSFCVTAETQKRPLSLLYFDAHPDLHPSYRGSQYSDATVVSRILERKQLTSGLVCYVGIRASTAEQEQRIKDFGLSAFTSRDVYKQGCETISTRLKSILSNEPVYVSIDLDCMDPAFAPGTGLPQAGGLSSRQLMDILHGIKGLEIVGADIVEYEPASDSPAYIHGRRTGLLACILIKELMGIMARPTS